MTDHHARPAFAAPDGDRRQYAVPFTCAVCGQPIESRVGRGDSHRGAWRHIPGAPVEIFQVRNGGYRCTECDTIHPTFAAAARCHYGTGHVTEVPL